MAKAILIKGSIYWELAYSFRGLFYYHHGGKHGNRQGRHGAGNVAESYVLILRQRETGA